MLNLKNHSLQSKMIAMNAAIVFVIGAGFFYQVMGFTGKQQDGVHDQFESLAKTTNDSVQAQFYERYGDVQAFAMNPQVHSRSGAEINSTLDAYAALYGIYDLIIVADLRGKIVGVNLKDPSGKDIPSKKLLGRSVADAMWFKNSVAGVFTEDKEKAFLGTYFEDVQVDPYVSEVYGEKRAGTGFSAPIKDENGKVIGVVSNRAGSRWFEGELQNVVSAAASQGLAHPIVSVVNKSGVLIGEAGIGADGKPFVQRDFSVLTTYNLVDGGPKGIDALLREKKPGHLIGLESRHDADYIWGFSPETGKKWVDAIGWSVIVSGSKDEAYAPVWAIRKNIFLGLGFFFLAAIVAGFFFSRSLAEKLRVMAKGLADNSGEVNQVAKLLATSSNELSSSSAEQAAALQETVASIDEVSAMVQKNADNAKRSQEISVVGSEKAQRGKSAVGEMIRSIDEINSSNQEIVKQIEEGNRQISEIVKVITEIGTKTKVINDIVFQTKLLSFNASVEAARAGEHGKGFAVVAEEVGNLAQMSGNAAKEISQMLDSSIAKVELIVSETQSRVERLTAMSREKIESGTVTAQRCGAVLDEIVHSVNEVNAMVTEIATASNEQAIGVNEINKAMNQLDQVTQANATVSQSAATSAEQLKGQSAAMSRIIEELVFSVEGTNGLRVRAREAVTSKPISRPASDSRRGDVLSFPKKPVSKKPLKVDASAAVSRVSGSDVAPSRNDSRFEEV